MFRFIKKIRGLSPLEIVNKTFKFIKRKTKQNGRYILDTLFSTYEKKTSSFLQHISYEVQVDNNNSILELAQLNHMHYFDLLGSGWQKNSYDTNCAGFENNKYCNLTKIKVDAKGEWLKSLLPKSCLEYSQKIYKQISKNYEPIDWQLDFKSGYRWSANTWYLNIKYGHLPGVDIKVPWELCRMQHLINYFYAYMLEESGKKKKYVIEYQNEILDFIAQNPPRFGVCWRCTMDVGIRIANWLIVYDLFCSVGVEFDAEFIEIFAGAVYDHGKHIINNLEYSKKLTSNHYLSDIAGLLFVATHLASNAETDAWLAFALQELESEMDREFHDDGSNFEASVSYHCLSTEIMLHCASLCARLPLERREQLKKYDCKLIKQEPGLNALSMQRYNLDNPEVLSKNFWGKLYKALQFVADICDKDGHIQQIGDSDSGRLFKLESVYKKELGRELKARYLNLNNCNIEDEFLYYDEDILNHLHLVKALEYLVRDKKNENANSNSIEQAILCAGNIYNNLFIDGNRKLPENIDAFLNDFLPDIPSGFNKEVYRFPSKNVLNEDIKVIGYDGFGIYIYKSNNLHLIARCGEVGQNGNGGHCHNDQLSMTLQIEGKDIITDVGSYIYTPNPQMRNKFRSTLMHFTPIVASGDFIEQNEWEEGREGLFSIKREKTFAQVLYFGIDGIIMTHKGFDTPVYRIIRICEREIVITDYGKNILRCVKPELRSNGYGKLLKY